MLAQSRSLEGALRQELRHNDFRECQSSNMAFDGFGNLYVVTPSGDLVGEDVRQRLADSCKEGGKVASPPTVCRKFFCHKPQPPLDPVASHFVVSSDGGYAAVAGTSSQDEELASAAVLDLRGARSVPGAVAEESNCDCTPIDAELLSSRPGLQILQVTWHPGSAQHLALLSSDNTWRLYCVADLTLAEQTFQLQLRATRGWGLDSQGSEQAVAFAFGQGQLWQQFTVYFLTTSGSVYFLCPVAPFSSSFQASSAQHLLAAASDSEDSPDSLTTQTWLQQALGWPLEDKVHDGVPEKRAGGAAVQPHALQEHTPLLQGPVEVACPDAELLSMMGMAQRDDIATSLALTWCDGECSVLTIATADGLVGWHLIAHSPAPEWAECAPNCVVEEGAILAVRNQVPVAEGCASEMLLLTVAQVRIEPRRVAEPGELWPGPPSVRLLPDPVHPERLFCVHAHSAHVLTAPWLPLLASRLTDGQGNLEASLHFRSTSAEELWASTATGPVCIGAAVVGDALTETALAVLLSDAASLYLWPSAASITPPLPIGPSRTAPDEVAAQVAAIYGDLLRGPRNMSVPQLTAVGAREAEGQRLLTDSIKALREKHVEFLHQAHHDLLKRLEEADSAARVQDVRAKQLAKAAQATDQRSHRLSNRLQKASQWNDNLQARVKLLTELHWALPHPLSDAENVLKQQELPRLVAEIRQLTVTIKGLSSRADAAKLGGSGRPLTPGLAVPAGQVQSLRAALVEQADLIATAQTLADVLEQQAVQIEES